MTGELSSPALPPGARPWLDSTLEKIPNAVLLTDTQGVIFHANPAACHIFNLPAQELLGQRFTSLSAWLQADWAALLFEQVLRTQAPARFEAYPVTLPQGEALILSGWFNPILEQDRLSGISFTAENITRQQQANQALQQSQERLDLALEAAGLSVLDWDIANDYLIADERLALQLSFDPGELSGSFSKLARLIHPDDAGAVLQQLNEHLEGKTSLVGCDLRLERSDRGWKWISFTGRVVEYDLLRRPRRMISVLRDITLRKQREEELERQQRMLSQITAAAPVIIYLYDLEEYRDIYINRQFAELLGYPLDEATRPGTNLFRYASFHPDDAEVLARTRQLYQQAADGEIVESEVRMRHYNGHWAWLHTRDTVYARNPNGSARIVLGIIEDITPRKEAEQALEAERAALALRVEEQTSDLRIANAELEKAARMKDEFLANMSHELRTPLNSILGSAEVLRERLLGDLNERQISLLNTIDESGHHLLSLINDVLDLSKIEAGMLTLELRPTSVDQVCQASLRMVRQAALKKQIAISYQFDNQQPIVQGDERRLKQILVNLLSNAVKFTPEGGQIGLEVSSSPDLHLISFNVWDSGIGIAEHDLERLFKPFVQLDSGLSRQYEGTGLGLSLVHRLVDLYGGSIQVKSAPGVGSSFIVILPSLTAQLSPTINESGSAPAEEDGCNLKEMSVLVAEDNPLFLNTLHTFLSARGCRVTLAHSGREALEQASLASLDAIIMDVHMPQMDGIETTRLLRSNLKMHSTPIIGLTALATTHSRQRCLAAGMNHCLSKPVNLSHLARVLYSFRPENTGAGGS